MRINEKQNQGHGWKSTKNKNWEMGSEPHYPQHKSLRGILWSQRNRETSDTKQHNQSIKRHNGWEENQSVITDGKKFDKFRRNYSIIQQKSCKIWDGK